MQLFFYRSGIGIGRGAIEKAGIKNQSIRKLCKDFSLYEYRIDWFFMDASIAKPPADADARPVKGKRNGLLARAVFWFEI